MSVTVVSCCYDSHTKFVPEWYAAVQALDPAPDEVIVASDRPLQFPADVISLVAPCEWKHPQAFYLNLAIDVARTDWVVIADVDDRLFPAALAGIQNAEMKLGIPHLERVDADVWMMGFRRSDGETYIPPPMTAEDVLAAATSLIPGSSAFRTEAFRSCGGFADVAFQDWALWRALARDGATFQSSGRAHFHYQLHDQTRTATELTPERRATHMGEMEVSEFVVTS